MVEHGGVDATGGERGEAVSGRLGEDEIDVACLQPGRRQERLDIDESDVVNTADADQLALELGDLFDGGLGEYRIGRRHDVIDDDLQRRALQRRAREIGIAAMADIERAGRELLGAPAAGRDEVELDIVLLEPAELCGDVLRPLRRAVRDHPGDDLRLRLGRAGGECRQDRQSQAQNQCAAQVRSSRDRRHQHLPTRLATPRRHKG